jgi:hypothetical protein
MDTSLYFLCCCFGVLPFPPLLHPLPFLFPHVYACLCKLSTPRYLADILLIPFFVTRA